MLAALLPPRERELEAKRRAELAPSAASSSGRVWATAPSEDASPAISASSVDT